MNKNVVVVVVDQFTISLFHTQSDRKSFSPISQAFKYQRPGYFFRFVQTGIIDCSPPEKHKSAFYLCFEQAYQNTFVFE